MLFFVPAGFADTESERGDFWICPCGETALYSSSGASFGGGLAFGYGKGTSIGMKAVWFFNSEGISILEINCIFRIYFFGKKAYSGPFMQFIGGPAIFYKNEDGVPTPSKTGAFSVGMSCGWRFLTENSWFIEPSVRGGYPYLAGAGLSVGMRF